MFLILQNENQISLDEQIRVYASIQQEFDSLLESFREKKSEYLRIFRRSRSSGEDVSNVDQEFDKNKLEMNWGLIEAETVRADNTRWTLVWNWGSH